MILQIICFVFVLNSDKWFPEDGSFAPRLSFLLAGIWWIGFGFYSLSRMPKPLAAGKGDAPGNIFSHGYSELGKVWKQIKQKKSEKESQNKQSDQSLGFDISKEGLSQFRKQKEESNPIASNFPQNSGISGNSGNSNLKNSINEMMSKEGLLPKNSSNSNTNS